MNNLQSTLFCIFYGGFTEQKPNLDFCSSVSIFRLSMAIFSLKGFLKVKLFKGNVQFMERSSCDTSKIGLVSIKAENLLLRWQNKDIDITQIET